jgi:hypothetical protein
MKRVLVCGGREFSDAELMNFHLGGVAKAEMDGKLFIIAGGQRGADYMAVSWAKANGHDFQEYPAQWAKYGRAVAGPKRNQQMLDEGKPDLVMAFPGGGGTADMVRRARNDGFETLEIRYGTIF